ncbi:MAG: glycosyltransferase family 4 protein [Leptospirillum sp.]
MTDHHLLIDATAGGRRLTGIERYTREVASAIWNLVPERNMRLSILIGNQDEWADGLKQHSMGTILRSPFKSRLLTDHGWVPSIISRIAPSEAFFPAFPPSPFVFFSKAKVLRTIHDVVLWEHRETTSWKNRFYFRPLENYGLFRYRTIMTVSERSKKDLCRLFPAISSRFVNAGNGLNPFWFESVPIEEREKIRIRTSLNGPFLLFVGTIEPRKNLPFLIKVFSRIRLDFPDLKLVLVGRKGWGYSALVEAIQEEGVGDKVICMDDVSDETLRALYQMALLFVYPSLNEGFGLPLPEAMASGLPIVASPEAASTEVVGDAVVYCNLDDPSQWVKMIKNLIMDQEQGNLLSSKGLLQAKHFKWESVARKVLDNILQ